MCGFVGMGWGRGLKATTKLELGCVMEAGSTAFIQKYQVKNLPGFGTQLASYYAHGAVGVRGVVLGDEADEETRPQLGLTPGLNAAPKEAPRLLALGKWNTRRICKLHLDGASCGRTKKSKATNLTMKNTLGARWHVR